MPKKPKRKSSNEELVLSAEERRGILALREVKAPSAEMLLWVDKKYNKLRDNYLRLKKQNKLILKENDYLETSLSLALDLRQERQLARIPKSPRTRGHAVVMAVLTDWHSEEKVDPASVNQKNEFDLDELRRRVHNLVRKILKMTNMYRSIARIDVLVLALLGDLISGYIHEELMESNALSPTEAVLLVNDLLEVSIAYLFRYGGFKHIELVCKIGNHGRTTAKPRVSTAASNSFEWLIYQCLSRTLRLKYGNKVNVIVEPSYLTYRTYFDRWTVRFHHGDYIRYAGGVGGISIPVNKAIAQWEIQQHADLDLFGHWHQYHDWGPWVSTSSLIGYNAFAVKIKAAYEPPTQTLVVIDREKGKWDSLPLFVAT